MFLIQISPRGIRPVIFSFFRIYPHVHFLTCVSLLPHKWLDLNQSALTTLPANVFVGLSSLTKLT